MSQEKTPAKKTPAKKKTSVKASERRKRASARAAAGLPKGPNGKAGQAERQQKYLDAREEGRFMYQAAADAGVTRTCVHHWRNCPYQGEEFRARELRAREVGVDRIKDAVRQIMEETASDNPAVAIRAAETLLKYENIHVTKLEVSGPGGGPVQVEVDPDDDRIARATAAWSSRILGEDAEDHSQE